MRLKESTEYPIIVQNDLRILEHPIWITPILHHTFRVTNYLQIIPMTENHLIQDVNYRQPKITTYPSLQLSFPQNLTEKSLSSNWATELAYLKWLVS